MTHFLNRTRRVVALQALLLATALSACGGGGGSADPGNPPAPPTAADPAPTLTTQPQDTSVVEGGSASFSVSATGTPPLSYQWQRNGADLPGATSATFTLATAGMSDHQATYRVRVSNAASVFSRTATLSVQAAAGNTLALLAGRFPSSLADNPVSQDGVGANARLLSITSMTSDANGDVYLTEPRSVRRITPDGTVVTLAAPTAFGSLSGIVIANDRSLYVADSRNYVVHRVSPTGQVSTLAGASAVQGTADGPADLARFSAPLGLARDRAGNVYVLDGNPRGCVDDSMLGSVSLYGGFTVRRIGIDGTVTTLTNASVPASTPDTVLLPGAIALDAQDNVYVSVTETPAPGIIFGVGCGSFRKAATAAYVQKATPAGQVTLFAGSRSAAGAADGAAANARFKWPAQIAFDRLGALLVADADNQAVRRIDVQGIVSTPVGQPPQAGPEFPDTFAGPLPGRLLHVPAVTALPTSAIVVATGWGAQLVLRTERR